MFGIEETQNLTKCLPFRLANWRTGRHFKLQTHYEGFPPNKLADREEFFNASTPLACPPGAESDVMLSEVEALNPIH